MCGIAAFVNSVAYLEWPDWPFWAGLTGKLPLETLHNPPTTDFTRFMPVLSRRGPDLQSTNHIRLHNGTSIDLLGAVLALRGELPVAQPVREGDDLLLFNGEVYSVPPEVVHIPRKHECDTITVLRGLRNANGDPQKMLHFLDHIQGPWSIIYWHHSSNRLYFARDILGRRSLLMNIKYRKTIIIASAVPAEDTHGFVELPPSGLFFFDAKQPNFPLGLIRRQATTLNHCLRVTRDTVNGNNSLVPKASLEASIMNTSFLPRKWLRSFSNADFRSPGVSPEISAQRFISVFKTSVKRRLVLSPRIHSNTGPHFALMFSGGIDSLFLALILDKCLHVCHSLDLINVAFGSAEDVRLCPDRVSAEDGMRELQTLLTPGRVVRLIHVNVTPSMADEAITNSVRPLIYPCDQLMDESIGTALWFTARGRGVCSTSTGNDSDANVPQLAHTTAKVYFSGLGADELMGGYKGRHRTIFRREGEDGIVTEMDKDLSRLWYRNFGRDDRVISDSGRELRHPFLDEDVIDFVTSLPVAHVCDLSLPDGVGDKQLLRRAAKILGLGEAATRRSKRAIQFGSRSKHVLERKRS